MGQQEILDYVDNNPNKILMSINMKKEMGLLSRPIAALRRLRSTDFIEWWYDSSYNRFYYFSIKSSQEFKEKMKKHNMQKLV